jgi:hypothetical protein
VSVGIALFDHAKLTGWDMCGVECFGATRGEAFLLKDIERGRVSTCELVIANVILVDRWKKHPFE